MIEGSRWLLRVPTIRPHLGDEGPLGLPAAQPPRGRRPAGSEGELPGERCRGAAGGTMETVPHVGGGGVRTWTSLPPKLSDGTRENGEDRNHSGL